MQLPYDCPCWPYCRNSSYPPGTYRRSCKQTCKLCIKCPGVQLWKSRRLPSDRSCNLFARLLTHRIYHLFGHRACSATVFWLCLPMSHMFLGQNCSTADGTSTGLVRRASFLGECGEWASAQREYRLWQDGCMQMSSGSQHVSTICSA